MPVENKILIRVESSVSLQMKILKGNTNADIFPTTPKQLLNSFTWAVFDALDKTCTESKNNNIG